MTTEPIRDKKQAAALAHYYKDRRDAVRRVEGSRKLFEKL